VTGDLWAQFLADRRILRGLSPETIRYYKAVGHEFNSILPVPTRTGILSAIEAMLARGMKPISINTRLRGLRCYCRWLLAEGHIPAPIKITLLKVEERLLPVLTESQISSIETYRPPGRVMARTRVAALLGLDCGLRAAELLGIRHSDIDWEASSIVVLRKGRKQTRVFISSEARRVLYRWAHGLSGEFIFGTRTGLRISTRTLERDMTALGQAVGIPGLYPHLLRHSYACAFLKAGGNIYTLSRLLNHSSVRVTEIYAKHLGVEAFKAEQERYTPLGKKGGTSK
jgi:integrase/recombinase XerD